MCFVWICLILSFFLLETTANQLGDFSSRLSLSPPPQRRLSFVSICVSVFHLLSPSITTTSQFLAIFASPYLFYFSLYKDFDLWIFRVSISFLRYIQIFQSSQRWRNATQKENQLNLSLSLESLLVVHACKFWLSFSSSHSYLVVAGFFPTKL